MWGCRKTSWDWSSQQRKKVVGIIGPNQMKLRLWNFRYHRTIGQAASYWKSFTSVALWLDYFLIFGHLQQWRLAQKADSKLGQISPQKYCLGKNFKNSPKVANFWLNLVTLIKLLRLLNGRRSSRLSFTESLSVFVDKLQLESHSLPVWPDG